MDLLIWSKKAASRTQKMAEQKKILGHYIMTAEQYNEWRKNKKELEEARDIIEDTEIHKKKIELTKQYQSEFGSWYEDKEGMIFQIKSLYYKRNSFWFGSDPGFYFEVWYPNHYDWDDISVDELQDCNQLSTAQAQLALGFKKVREANDK